MSIDKSTIDETTEIPHFDTPLVVFERENKFENDVAVHYKFRYTVNRQYVGFFTPMFFDVRFTLNISILDYYRRPAETLLDRIAEPFVEGALFVNHSSSMLVEYFKGTNFNINRAEMIQNIRKSVTSPHDLCSPVWYSDWAVPISTIQNQRIFVYDVENPQHGSMLDPQNAINFIARWYDAQGSQTTLLKKGEILGGYTQKVTKHAH